MWSMLRSIWIVFKHAFAKRFTVLYPEKKRRLPPRWRGRIILTRDPDGQERCVACNLCAVACPVGCIALQAATDETGRRYPEFFRINFSRCIFCGFCEEACPTFAIQLTPDYEMAEYDRHSLVYEKEHLLISGTGKYPGYNFYRVAGLEIGGKGKGEEEIERPPVDVKSLLPQHSRQAVRRRPEGACPLAANRGPRAGGRQKRRVSGLPCAGNPREPTPASSGRAGTRRLQG